MVQLPIKDIVSDALRLSVREPRVFVTLSWVSLLVSTAMFMSAYLAQDRTVKTVVAAIACILQRVFDTESLSRLMGEMFVAPHRDLLGQIWSTMNVRLVCKFHPCLLCVKVAIRHELRL